MTDRVTAWCKARPLPIQHVQLYNNIHKVKHDQLGWKKKKKNVSGITTQPFQWFDHVQNITPRSDNNSHNLTLH